MENRLKIEFGIPYYGWLSVNLQWQNFELEIEISNVPSDPMEQLCDSLIELLKGINEPQNIIWHLEPQCFYLKLKKIEEKYEITIYEYDEYKSKPLNFVKKIEGSYEEIILPIYRNLKKFNSYSYEKPHWDRMNGKRINELTDLIKK